MQLNKGPGVQAPETIIFDKSQLGQKWGKHKFDYPNLNSHTEYQYLAEDIFKYSDYKKFDFTHNEFYYIRGNDLLRLSPSGDFISLYPGAGSDRVINAMNALKS